MVLPRTSSILLKGWNFIPNAFDVYLRISILEKTIVNMFSTSKSCKQRFRGNKPQFKEINATAKKSAFPLEVNRIQDIACCVGVHIFHVEFGCLMTLIVMQQLNFTFFLIRKRQLKIIRAAAYVYLRYGDSQMRLTCAALLALLPRWAPFLFLLLLFFLF